MLLLTSNAQAAQVSFVWDDPHNDPAKVAGYILYYWQPGWNTPGSVDVGKQKTYSFSDLEVGRTYHFAVTAYNPAGDESVFSNQVSATISNPTANSAPVAGADTATTRQNTGVNIAVLANDTDADGNTLSLTAVGPAANGTTARSGVAVLYTPRANFHGTDTFTYTVSDGLGGTATGKVTVTVSAASSPPVAAADTATTREDTGVTIAVLANDTDADGNTLSLSAVGPAANGTTARSGVAVLYTPRANFHGTDTFTYTVSDGQGGTATGKVTVTVSPVNDPPVASHGTLTTKEGTAASGLLRASDIDGDTLTYSLVANGHKGTATLTKAATGAYTYTPHPNATGTDTFTFQARDGMTNSNIATVTITISSEDTKTVVFAVNAGGATYVGNDGTVYQADTRFSGGQTYTRSVAMAGTEDDVLYQSERYGNFAYAVPVSTGDYVVTLKFAEIFWTALGKRLFDVVIEGREVLGDLDLVAKVGPLTAYDVTVPVLVTDGVLNIQFVSSINYAKVSAIVVETQEDTPPPPPDPEVIFAVNAGGATYVGNDGTVYQADTRFSGGQTYTRSVAIAGTEDDVLYQSERYGNFAYAVPVSTGDYVVTLKFAEIFWTAAGKRLFDVVIEGREVLGDLDLVAKVGPLTAYDVTVPVLVTDGVLNIQFVSSINYAKVSAIVVETQEDTP
jgi:hypothetical protein